MQNNQICGRMDTWLLITDQIFLPASSRSHILQYVRTSSSQIVGSLEGKTKHSSTVQTIGRREHTIIQQKRGCEGNSHKLCFDNHVSTHDTATARDYCC